jgi:hypothetical protein
MVVNFTWEDNGNKNRVKYMCGALWRNGHRIVRMASEGLPKALCC